MFYAVIPAGGSGTRLWPLSRAGRPKFLQALTGTADSLLQATVARVAALAPPERTYVVTGAAHAASVTRQLHQVPTENIVVEPSPKDSCAAIMLAAALIAERDPGAVVGSFAADQLIRDIDRFVADVRQAEIGAQAGYIVTIGLTPTRPDIGFGYIKCADPVPGLPIRHVTGFTEKPDRATAEEFLRAGGYLWNASIFVARARVLLEELARQRPDMHAAITEIAAAWHTDLREKVLQRVWPELPRIAIDYAVIEGAAAAGRVATVPGGFDWNDVGDFHTLGTVFGGDRDGVVVIGAPPDAKVIARDCTDLVVVPAGDRLVAALGLRDAVIVDTPDVVLVCPRDRVQDLKGLVAEMRDTDLASYL